MLSDHQLTTNSQGQLYRINAVNLSSSIPTRKAIRSFRLSYKDALFPPKVGYGSSESTLWNEFWKAFHVLLDGDFSEISVLSSKIASRYSLIFSLSFPSSAALALNASQLLAVPFSSVLALRSSRSNTSYLASSSANSLCRYNKLRAERRSKRRYITVLLSLSLAMNAAREG